MADPIELVQLSFSAGEVVQIVVGVGVCWKGYYSIMSKINENHLAVIEQVGDITGDVNKKINILEKELTASITDTKEILRKETSEKVSKVYDKIDELKSSITHLIPPQ